MCYHIVKLVVNSNTVIITKLSMFCLEFTLAVQGYSYSLGSISNVTRVVFKKTGVSALCRLGHDWSLTYTDNAWQE